MKKSNVGSLSQPLDTGESRDLASRCEFRSRIVLHVGAHRTGTTLFQEYLRRSQQSASSHGIFLRGINETRKSLLRGFMYREIDDDLRDEQGSLTALREHMTKDSLRALVSDENILGTMEDNFLVGALYPSPAESISRVREIIPEFDTIYISIRSYASWWSSAFAYLFVTNRLMFHKGMFEQIVENQRGWADVIGEIMEAFPQATIIVREFAYQTDNPKRQMREVTGWRDLSDYPNYREVSNKSVGIDTLESKLRESGRIRLADALRAGPGLGPFTIEEHQRLGARYARDLRKILIMLNGRGRMLIDPKTKRLIEPE